jgi:hypothetical protein
LDFGVAIGVDAMDIEGAVEELYPPCDGPRQVVFRMENHILYFVNPSPGADPDENMSNLLYEQLLAAIHQRDIEAGQPDAPLPVLELDLFELKQTCIERGVNIMNRDIAAPNNISIEDIPRYEGN